MLSLFLLPLIFVAVFGSLFASGIEEGGEPRSLMVFHHDANQDAAAAVARLSNSGAFRVLTSNSPDALREWVADDESRVGLILAADWGTAATSTPAELVIDRAAPRRFRGPIQGAMLALLRTPASGAELGRAAFVVRSPPGTRAPLARVSGFQVSVPGNAVLFGFFLALTMALSFVEERRLGTWRRLLAAPVRRPVLLFAKLVPYYLIGLVQMTFLFGAGALFFEMRVAGSIEALIALTAAVVYAAVGFGLLISSFGGTEKQIGSIGSIALLVMGLMGGAMVPRLTMPETMQAIGLATPHAWALDGYYDLLLRPGTTLADVGQSIVAVLCFGCVFMLVGTMRFRWNR